MSHLIMVLKYVFQYVCTYGLENLQFTSSVYIILLLRLFKQKCFPFDTWILIFNSVLTLDFKEFSEIKITFQELGIASLTLFISEIQLLLIKSLL